jgi:hypothetical protein
LKPCRGGGAIRLQPLLSDEFNIGEPVGGLGDVIEPGDGAFGRSSGQIIDVTGDGGVPRCAGRKSIEPFFGASGILGGSVFDDSLKGVLAEIGITKT